MLNFHSPEGARQPAQAGFALHSRGLEPHGTRHIPDLMLNLHRPHGTRRIPDLMLNLHQPHGSCGIADLTLNLHWNRAPHAATEMMVFE